MAVKKETEEEPALLWTEEQILNAIPNRSDWVDQDTAILVIHGIGHQNPFETLDTFGRNLISVYQKYYRHELELEHCLAKKQSSDGGSAVWFDNYIRIKRKNAPEGSPSIDLYEYYWANYTEDQATLDDVSRWVSKVSSGARKFYTANADLGKKYGDTSIFFSSTGEFRSNRYFLFLTCAATLPLMYSGIVNGIAFLLKLIPVAGLALSNGFKNLAKGKLTDLLNVVSDVTIYNSTDAKSKYYQVRQRILDGAVKAIRYLVEPHQQDDQQLLRYQKVLIAGHSLGTQIGFDAINRLNHLVNAGEVNMCDERGAWKPGFNPGREDCKAVKDVLAGFVTFGSPLDKIAFFFRDQVEEGAYLHSQIIKSYHSFKQKDWTSTNTTTDMPVSSPFYSRVFDEVPWRNYYDNHDPVSGSLDYYKEVKNIRCSFTNSNFTHSHYWECKEMYADIVYNLLHSSNKPASMPPPALAAEVLAN